MDFFNLELSLLTNMQFVVFLITTISIDFVFEHTPLKLNLTITFKKFKRNALVNTQSP